MTCPEHQTASLQLHLFGPFEVRLNGAPLPRLRSRKHAAILALLTLRHGRPVDRARSGGSSLLLATGLHGQDSCIHARLTP